MLPNVWYVLFGPKCEVEHVTHRSDRAMTKDDRSGFPPEEFIPERHMADKVKETAIDPYAYAFGFGRR